MSESLSLSRFSSEKIMSYALVFFTSLVIFFIAQVIQFYLGAYDFNTMYISFCAGFVLFIPLVSLVLHPLLLNKEGKRDTFHFSDLLANIGLVCVVQFLFFLIWITDAIALYSIYVDQNSFLAKAFDIQTQARGDMTFEFYCFNFVLAWVFALLSMVVGLLPCLIARLDNLGIVGNFVAAFSLAKRHKGMFCLYALLITSSVLVPLLYAKYLFLVVFPTVLVWVFISLNEKYLLLPTSKK
ncbi:hypothetical protein [Candidatus Colwellia aromaticivorans]|uniref:hypothetical protein n=1 Tax=Candidatus Colwellia aromaticivorans TaxID=2267621 RepID=UPI00109B8697|nr:hypothetical protein [Candidatus Colwellia aromaticivorans]